MIATAPIQLIVGLGNPGDQYAETRHNVGVWFVERLAHDLGADFKHEPKFHGLLTSVSSDKFLSKPSSENKAGQLQSDRKIWLLIPTTFMNLSGQSVRVVANFYHIPPEAILVVHDELDFPPDVIRLKQGGGHGGHNGLRNIIEHLNANNFHRLRIGIGHPGHSSKVHDYVLSRPSKQDRELIISTIDRGIEVLPELVSGNIQQAIQRLHTIS